MILRIVNDDLPKRDPELYEEFKRVCRLESITPKQALQNIGVTAPELLESFDAWYDVWAEDGKSGMECLIWEVWSEINALVKQRVADGSVDQ